MGTWKITKPTSIVSKTGAQYVEELNSLLDDASLITGLLGSQSLGEGLEIGAFSPPNTALSGIIRFNFDLSSAIISLDGNPAISFNSLPAGFTPSSATISFKYQISSNTGTIWFIQLDSNTESIAFSTTGAILLASLVYNFSFPQPSMLDIINNGFGIRTSFGNNNDFTIISDFSLSGNYSTLSYTWTITPNIGVKAGDQVTVNGISSLANQGGLGRVTQIHVQYVDVNGKLHDTVILSQDFISQSSTQIIFYFPQIGNLVTGSIVQILATVSSLPNDPLLPFGTQFSGSVKLGTLTITFADASGIYILVPGKSTDSIYDRATPGATKEVNIPDPFIKTGFVP